MAVLNPLNLSFGTPDSMRLVMARLNAAAQSQATARELYDLLAAYYYANGLYDWLAANRFEAGIKGEALKNIRTPAYRIIEFYVAHLWPGDLDDAFPIETENERLKEPIDQIWEWSNWGAEKDVAALWYPLYGDLFLRVAQPDDRRQVHLEVLDPHHVTDFEAQRGILKMIRLDVPQEGNGDARRWVHTEVWEKGSPGSGGRFRQWRHEQGLDRELDDLGTPEIEDSLLAFGVDFLPFCHAPFINVGEKRGMSVLTPLLDKMDELNRKATRHSQLMFRHIDDSQALEAAADSTGAPRPAVRIRADDTDYITLGQSKYLALPGGWSVKSTTPDLNYDAYLQTILSEEKSLAADAPEMLWSRLSETNDLSGRALRYLMAPAIKRVERARATAERVILRALQMGLTIGTTAGLWNVGSYEAGDFAMTLAKRDVLPTDTLEDAQARQADAEADLKERDLGIPLRMILERRGLPDEEIEAILQEAEERRAEMVAAQAAAATQAAPQNGQAPGQQPAALARQNGSASGAG